MRPTVHVAKEVGARLGFRHLLLRCLPLAGAALVAGFAQPRPPTPALRALLETDRRFGGAGDTVPMPQALAGMMAADVMMGYAAPAEGPRFAQGIVEVRRALALDAREAEGRAAWRPTGGGISADGTHGFTYGLLDVRRADGTTAPYRYLSYWVRGSDGWRVRLYRRVRRAAGAADTTLHLLAPATPAATGDATAVESHRTALADAEREFARESQRLGLRAGFERFGDAEAVNLGDPSMVDFVRGNAAIAAFVSRNVPEGTSPVDWSPTWTLVAGSGDLGVNIGYIVPNAAPPEGQPRPRFPFFTVWRRAAPGVPWRYVAE